MLKKVLLYFRDGIVYATSTFTEGLPTVMNVLSDGIFRQHIDDDLVRKSPSLCFVILSKNHISNTKLTKKDNMTLY